MKKQFSLLLLINVSTNALSMETIKQLSPRNIKLQKYHPIPVDSIIKNAKKAKTTADLLRIIHYAKNDHNITESLIGVHALDQKKLSPKNQLLFLQMKRVELYNQDLKKKCLKCPVIHLNDNFETTMFLYKKFREARINGNNCGLEITINQQHYATPYPVEISPNIGFKEFIRLEIDLENLFFKERLFDKMIAMIIAQKSNTTPILPLIPLDSDDSTTKNHL